MPILVLIVFSILGMMYMGCLLYTSSMRGVKKPGAKTTTRAVRGCFETDADARSEALSLIFRH